MNEPLTLRPVSGLADVARISAAAREERHIAVAPTHAVERAGELLGYASVNAVPILTGWLSEKGIGRDEARGIVAQLEGMVKAEGRPFVCMPCTEDCRFGSEMAAMGYRRVGAVTLYFKQL